MNFEVKIFPRFGDFRIKWQGELKDPFELLNFMNENMEQWKKDDRPSIWIRLRGKDLDHLNALISYGFKIHRVKPINVLILNKWIRDYSYTLPPPPFSYLGVGGMCINEEGKVLCVRENYKTGPGPWKLPGGLFDCSKDRKLSDAVIREIKEETGIVAEFDHIVNSRFVHQGGIYKAPDLYTIIRCHPVTTEIKFDPVEIYDCQWIELDTLAENSYKMLKFAIDAEKAGAPGFHEELLDTTSLRLAGHYLYGPELEKHNEE